MAEEKRTMREWDRTYAEYKRQRHIEQWEQRHERRIKRLARYDARRQLYPNFFMFYWGYLLDWNYDGKIFSAARTERLNKLLPPHYLKHPTEDRMVTWPQWKHAQKAVLRDQHRLYHEMYVNHNLFFRWAVWVSRTDEKYNPVKIIYRKATPHLKQSGKIFVHWMRHPEQHITPFDRLFMKQWGLTREEMLARKPEDIAARREGRKFWKLVTESKMVHRIKTIVNNRRNQARR
jgi:hypothetical protein